MSNEGKNLLYLSQIKIPIIQRDYVQGRDDEEARDVRERFLEDIFEKLKNNQKFHLDFVFGTFEKEQFIPIDGQQRLTTLYLLYLYFSKREGKEFNIKLTYETRRSSKEFIQTLSEIEIDFNHPSISEQIIINKKFIPYWKFDPTVQSMLNMLDDIHKRANELYEHNIENIFERLNNITFSIFDLEDLGKEQAEELYRKMNARGKTLTELENFKAILEQIAFKKDINRYKEIAMNFETKWTEFFWKYRDENYLVDKPFMNFIYFVSEMLLYQKNGANTKIVNISFNTLKKLYEDTYNFNLLIEILNKLDKILEIADNVKNNLVLFTESNMNLIDEIIRNYDKTSYTIKILAYYIILGSLNYSNPQYTLELIRIVRNYLNRNRALKQGYINYILTIDYKDIPISIRKYQSLLNKDQSPYILLKEIGDTYEQKIAKIIENNPQIKESLFNLEDNLNIKGDLRFLLSLNLNLNDEQKILFFNKIIPILFEQIPTDITARAILTFGNYSIWRGYILIGQKYFFGNKNYWEIFLTENPHIKKKKYILEQFFNHLIHLEDINQSSLQSYLIELINKKIKEKEVNKEYTWIYYFLKYPIILYEDTKINGTKLKNVFAFYVSKGDIEKLEKEKRVTDNRQNVYILALLSELQKKFPNIPFISNVAYLSYYKLDNKLTIEISNNRIIINVNNESKEFQLFSDYDGVKAAADYIISSIQNL